VTSDRNELDRGKCSHRMDFPVHFESEGTIGNARVGFWTRQTSNWLTANTLTTTNHSEKRFEACREQPWTYMTTSETRPSYIDWSMVSLPRMSWTASLLMTPKASSGTGRIVLFGSLRIQTNRIGLLKFGDCRNCWDGEGGFLFPCLLANGLMLSTPGSNDHRLFWLGQTTK
jgi:hypothetical protein